MEHIPWWRKVSRFLVQLIYGILVVGSFIGTLFAIWLVGSVQP